MRPCTLRPCTETLPVGTHRLTAALVIAPLLTAPLVKGETP